VYPLAKPKVAISLSFLRYGWPIFAGQLLLVVASNADRYVVGLVGLTPSDLTAYVAHSRLAGVVNVLILAPINLWFPIEAMRRDHIADRSFFIGVVLTVLTAFAFVVPAVQLAAPVIWSHVFPTISYRPVLMIALMLTIGFQVLAVVWNVGMLKPGHTHWNIAPPAAGGVTIIVLGPILGKMFGLDGVALARTLSAALSAMTILMLSNRISLISMPLHRLAPALIGLGLSVALVLCDWAFPVKLALAASVLACLALNILLNRALLMEAIKGHT
jgi:hypothetical protein